MTMTINELTKKIDLFNSLLSMTKQTKRDLDKELELAKLIGADSLLSCKSLITGDWIKEANKDAETAAMVAIRSAADPMLAAISKLEFTRYSVREDKDTDELSLSEYSVTFDPVKLDKFCGGKFATNSAWQYIMNRLYLQVVARQYLAVGDKESAQSFAEQVRMPANLFKSASEPMAVATSKAQIKASLKELTSAMLGESVKEFKRLPDDRDAAYLGIVSTKHGKTARSVATVNSATFGKYVLEMLNCAMNGGVYSREYTKRKDGKNSVVVSTEE